MSLLDLAEPPWCERTQDMSGYVFPDSISPPLDEQFDFTISTAQNESDFYVQNSGYPSPDEFVQGDVNEAVLTEDSNLFDNSNYSVLHSKIKEWLPSISTMEIDDFAKNSMIEKGGDILPHLELENSLIFSDKSKVVTQPSTTINKKSRFLSMFECEEPYIKEDPDIISCCTDVKLTFDLRDELEVAEEVVVTTEQDESPFLFGSTSPEYSIEPKEEVVVTSERVERLSSPPLSRSFAMETPFDFDMDFIDEEDFFYNIDTPTSPTPVPRVPLHLDIEAALVSSTQLLSGLLPDTPEVLKPVLKPEAEFDLVNFLLANGECNNNTVTSTTTTKAPETNLRLQQRRQGKSHLTLADLKACEKYGRGKPSPMPFEETCQPVPTPSTSTGRPARKSATKFKKLLEEGLLGSPLDSRSASSDDEDSPPKRKRRRSISSSSSRRRLNSDSDRSSICENPLKYRERRDRNNLSSKRSRQKRKVQQELTKMELKDLERENKRLKKRAEELALVLDKVHKAWKEYLVKMKKDNDKDKGEH